MEDEISKWKQEENSPNDIEVINFYRRCLVHGNTNFIVTLIEYNLRQVKQRRPRN